MSKHFANTGQVLQLLAAALAIVIAGVNAYPNIQSFNFLALWPIVFYIILILVVASVFAYQFRHDRERGQPAPNAKTEVRLKPDLRVKTFTMKLGELWTGGNPGSADDVKIIFNGVEKNKNDLVCADLTVNAFINSGGGEKIAKIGHNRYLIPASNIYWHADSIASYSFSDSNFSFFGIGVTHINEH